MRPLRSVLLTLIVSCSVCAQEWSRIADFPGTKRDDGTSAVLNGKAYFGTGLQEGWTSTVDWHALDLYTLTWEQITDMPAGAERQYACAFTALNSVFVFGGDNYGGLNDLYRYDPVQKSWQSRASKPGIGVIGAACLTFGDKAFIIGGKVHHDSLPVKEVWEYNATNDTWQRKADLPFAARWRAAAASLGPLGYVAGGITDGGEFLNDFLVYDPGEDHWQFLDSLPVSSPVSYSTLQPLTNKLVLFGGQDTAGVFSKEMWYFRAAQGAWERGPDIPADGRRGGMAVGWNERLVYTCGLGPGDQRLNETWMLDLPLGLADESTTQISIYPNPCADSFTVESDFDAQRIRVFQPDGKLVLDQTLQENLRDIDCRQWQAGFFIIELTDGKGLVTRARLIKL